MADDDFPDFVAAPNISANPDVYELENLALRRDGRLDLALFDVAPWTGRTIVDVGCGTGFWLPTYAERAAHVIGVEPDPRLLELAERRVADDARIDIRHGSAERLPLGDATADVAHARFAYFFGEGAEAGLAEVRRVLRPGGTFIAIDNSWTGGDFARLLHLATTGNAAIDPERTARWWTARGAARLEVEGGWRAASRDELERILEIEFPREVVAEFMHDRTSAELTYRFALYVLRASS